MEYADDVIITRNSTTKILQKIKRKFKQDIFEYRRKKNKNYFTNSNKDNLAGHGKHVVLKASFKDGQGSI